jgi:hypothetical protein
MCWCSLKVAAADGGKNTLTKQCFWGSRTHCIRTCHMFCHGQQWQYGYKRVYPGRHRGSRHDLHRTYRCAAAVHCRGAPQEFPTLPLLSLLLCSSPSPPSACFFTSARVSDTTLAISLAVLITLSSPATFPPAREFQTLPLPSLLLCSSPCPSSALFQQDVSFRRFPCRLCCSAHHPVRRQHYFTRTRVSDASFAMSAALLIALSFIGILSPAREFQRLALPSLLLCSSPSPPSARWNSFSPAHEFQMLDVGHCLGLLGWACRISPRSPGPRESRERSRLDVPSNVGRSSE